MTQEKYLSMCEQLGREPDPEQMPPDIQDFPDLAIAALSTFNMLGDRIFPDIGFIGKDYANLKYYMEIYGIEDKELFLEILTLLESRAVKQSQEALKREREKLKRKR